MHEVDFGSLLGTALGGFGGGGVVVFIAKTYLSRTLKELDGVIVAMHSVKEQLAMIAVKLAKIEENDKLLREHDRKIAALEAKVFRPNVETNH